MRSSGPSDALKKYYKRRGARRDPALIVEAIKSENDRTFVIILGSVLEDALESQLEKKMRPFESETERNAIFGVDAPAGTFSAKIRMAYALSVIDKGMKSQLDDLREIRNACAHSVLPLSFHTPELIGMCERFFRKEVGAFVQLNGDKTSAEMRMIFLMECFALMAMILQGSREAGHSHFNKILTPYFTRKGAESAPVEKPKKASRKKDSAE